MSRTVSAIMCWKHRQTSITHLKSDRWRLSITDTHQLLKIHQIIMKCFVPLMDEGDIWKPTEITTLRDQETNHWPCKKSTWVIISFTSAGGTFTFKQQRHEGYFRRLHFLESISVGFVIHRWILRKKSDESLYVTLEARRLMYIS